MAFLQSSPPREPFLQAPASVLWLIGALVAVYLVTAYGPIPDAVLWAYAFVPQRYAEGGSVLALTVPLVSHMFLHGGLFHLTVNCMWLLAFGPVVARRYGAVPFFAFFLLCGVAGALAHLAGNWGSPDPMIGASGGISGLMAAGFRLMRLPSVYSGQRLTPVLSRPILSISLVWLAVNAVVGITGMGSQGHIAWQAHMGGYLFGLLAIGAMDGLCRKTIASDGPPL